MNIHKFSIGYFVVIANLFHVYGDKTIGAILDDGIFLLDAVFNIAVSSLNEEEDPFLPNAIRTSPGDVLEAQTAMCTLLESNILGIVGPMNKDTILHIQTVADFLEVPQILTQPIETQNRNWSVVNLYPRHNAYSQVFADIIQMKGWTEFTIIYEGAELLPFLDNILTMQDIDSGPVIVMNVVQLSDNGDFRSQLKTIKSSGSVNYLVECSLESLPLFLQQAQQVGIMSDEHSYIIMNPDLQTIDIEPYKHGGSNITGIRFFDPSLETIQKLIEAINEKVAQLSDDNIPKALEENGLTLNLALVHDAVTLLTSALTSLGLSAGPSLTCQGEEGWPLGSTVVNYIRTMEEDGLTGIIKFDEDGFRSDFEIDVLEVMAHGFEKVAQWTEENGLEETRKIVPSADAEGTDTMKGKHFIVLTALSAPYGMLKESAKKLEGNDRYEGFGIELIQELAKMNEFNFTFEIQADGVYGSLDKSTGKWTGMMEKVMDGRVDFAITDLTITSTRQKAVDFTSPFMNLGITILYKKPTKEPPNLFSFISPFSLEVWGWLAGAYVGVSVLLFVLGRLAPEEWQNPYPCIEEPETLDNQFTMANSFWFTLGSVLTQGSEIAPIAVSTRMAGSMWWFFTLIMVSSYTANLAAFLTVESKFYAIKSVQDLASNPYDIVYGAKKQGATLGFFKESDNLLYQKMYQYMNDHVEFQTATNDEGLERVKSDSENYAFLMESTSIEYMVERNCDVAQVGGLLDSKGYGIAMKKNSEYRQPMSESILQLQEQGKLTRLKDKWWKEKRGGGACADDAAGSAEAQPLVLANVGGVFIVLVAGSGMAVICAFFEMLVDVWTISRREKFVNFILPELHAPVYILLLPAFVYGCHLMTKVPFKEELIAELKFIFTSSGDIKPVRHPQESTHSGSSNKEDEEKKSGDVELADDELLDVPPTPHSERSHSGHGLHSRRQSNAVQMSKMRKFSLKSRNGNTSLL